MGVLLHAHPDQGDEWHRQQKTRRARACRFESQPSLVSEFENPHGAKLHVVRAAMATTKKRCLDHYDQSVSPVLLL